MATDNRSSLVRELDAQIAQVERLANTAQEWANRLGGLSNDLAVLKRARALVMNPMTAEHPDRSTTELIYVAPESAPLPQQEVEQSLSIGALILTVLNEARTPMKVQAILKAIHAKGRTEITVKSLGGVLAQYYSKGHLRRTRRATYALPLSKNGVPANGVQADVN